jgi:hypothetical protein
MSVTDIDPKSHRRNDSRRSPEAQLGSTIVSGASITMPRWPAPAILLPPKGRDLRLDFFRGIANWAIFLNHIPNNIASWITIKHYGFSDAADMFVFISGYTAGFVYARMMLERGTVTATGRIIRQAWQIYVAHIFLLVLYIVEIGYLAREYGNSGLIEEFNIFGILRDPIELLYQGLTLRFKPVNMDVLPLYIALISAFPAILWAMLRKPNATLLSSFILYCAARHFGWNFSAFPTGGWYFNPLAWQFLFVFGAWCALGGAHQFMGFAGSRAFQALAVTFLIGALLITVVGQNLALGSFIPAWLHGQVNSIDKTNLDPLRVVHFLLLVVVVLRILPRDGPLLKRSIFRPAILCGQQSLDVFCLGIVLSFAAHFVLVQVCNAVWMQVIVSVSGIVLMTALAYYRSWSKPTFVGVVL